MNATTITPTTITATTMGFRHRHADPTTVEESALIAVFATLFQHDRRFFLDNPAFVAAGHVLRVQHCGLWEAGKPQRPRIKAVTTCIKNRGYRGTVDTTYAILWFAVAGLDPNGDMKHELAFRSNDRHAPLTSYEAFQTFLEATLVTRIVVEKLGKNKKRASDIMAEGLRRRHIVDGYATAHGKCLTQADAGTLTGDFTRDAFNLDLQSRLRVQPMEMAVSAS